MQRIITVRLEDLYPLEDEFGNQYASRDYSTKANKEYVQELADSMRMKGIPDEPISVVADGGIYRIKTGNSRVMAMREIGTVECPAIIDDDDTVQSVLEAVIRTDTKKKYEDIERSRFTQQLFMFGDDDYVSEVTGLEAAKVAKIRRTAKKVDDAAEDLTLDRLLLIDEFSDDPEAVEKLTNCRENEADNIAYALRRDKQRKEQRAALTAALEEMGIPYTDDRATIQGKGYYSTVTDPAKLEEGLPEEWEDGQVEACFYNTWDGIRCEIFVESDEDEEQSEIHRMTDVYEKALKDMDDTRFAWFWDNLANGKPMPNLARECRYYFEHSWQVEQAVKEMSEECRDAAKNGDLSIYDFAVGFEAIDTEGSRWYGDVLAKEEVQEYRRAQLNKYLDELALYQADGWDPGDSTAIIKKLSEIAEWEEVEDND